MLYYIGEKKGNSIDFLGCVWYHYFALNNGISGVNLSDYKGYDAVLRLRIVGGVVFLRCFFAEMQFPVLKKCVKFYNFYGRKDHE